MARVLLCVCVITTVGYISIFFLLLLFSDKIVIVAVWLATYFFLPRSAFEGRTEREREVRTS